MAVVVIVMRHGWRVICFVVAGDGAIGFSRRASLQRGHYDQNYTTGRGQAKGVRRFEAGEYRGIQWLRRHHVVHGAQ